MPPSAGPAIVAICQVEELIATAVPNCSRGTRLGNSAWPVGIWKARATPNSTMTREHGCHADSSPRTHDHEQQQRADELERVAGRHDAAAVTAVGEVAGRQDVSSTKGRNCDSPIRPRSSGSRVTS